MLTVVTVRTVALKEATAVAVARVLLAWGATVLTGLQCRAGAVADALDARASSIDNSLGCVTSSPLTSCPCSGTALLAQLGVTLSGTRVSVGWD